MKHRQRFFYLTGAAIFFLIAVISIFSMEYRAYYILAFKASLFRDIQVLSELHSPIREPGPTDWLAKHNEEGQTFEEYLNSSPILPEEKRSTIYISLLGEFSREERKIVNISLEFLEIYYNLPVKHQKEISLNDIPDEYKRKSPIDGVTQYNTRYIMYDILKPNIPKDAVVYFAITTEGLWPGKNWNYVHGEASLYDRVAVSTLQGYGNPSENGKINTQFLIRAMKVITHEVGHMFSMNHCIKYECNMCGSNNIPEMDRKPLWLCPECMAKACWLTKITPEERYEKLLAFCKKYNLNEEMEFYKKSLDLLRKQEQ